MLKVAIVLTMLISVPSTNKKSPIIATALSVLPGGGQFYTENYLKGALFAAVQTSLLVLTIKENNPDKRYDLLWWDVIAWALSMGDAYISAHFYKFKKQNKIGIEIGFKIRDQRRQ